MKIVAILIFVSLLIVSTSRADDKDDKKELLDVTGDVVSLEKVSSKYVDERRVDIWLPPSYSKTADKRYPVLYMHDGQNLFDPKLSYIGVDWGIDETMTNLIAKDEIEEAIVVGVWNTPKRPSEYMPQKALQTPKGEEILKKFTEATKSKAELYSDNYLKFLVQELKPLIDSKFRTKIDRENTFIMGSSMGGLISLYALCEYPEVFSGAGCVSTHWPIGEGIVIDYLKTALPKPGSHKIYFDFGTETLDAQYEPYQKRADEVMKAGGYKENIDWITRKFEGEDHSERAWRKRVDIPIKFFLKKKG
ncbi:MAG: alpha/beta hydrolase [Blastocatellia bacterium]|nr:alpha/beta hydrolase [Blastocatellia bacterium]